MVNNIFEEVKKNSKLHNLVCLWVDLGSCGSLVHSRMLEWEFLRICCVNSVISLPAWVKGRIKLSPVSIFFCLNRCILLTFVSKIRYEYYYSNLFAPFPLPLSFVRLKKCWNFAHGSMFKIKLPLVYLFFQELIFFQS